MAFTLGGGLLESEVAGNGIDMALEPAKCSTLLEAIDGNGMDERPSTVLKMDYLRRARSSRRTELITMYDGTRLF